MKVKLLMARATLAGGENRGDIIEVTAAEGERMIAAEQAELVRSGKSAEKAVPAAKAEKAAK